MSELLTTKEVAKKLNIHPQTVRELIKKKKLKAIKVESIFRIYSDSLEEYILKNKVGECNENIESDKKLY